MKKWIIGGLSLLPFIEVIIFILFLNHIREQYDELWSLFLVPVISLSVGIVFYISIKIEMRESDHIQLGGYILGHIFINMLNLLIIVYTMTEINYLEVDLSFEHSACIITYIFMIVTGIIMPRSKKNWFMGIRTGWSLYDDFTWKETQRIGGRIWSIGGSIGLIFTIFIRSWTTIVIVLIVLMTGLTIISVIVSYQIYKKYIGDKN